jgi:hypothetical protein
MKLNRLFALITLAFFLIVQTAPAEDRPSLVLVAKASDEAGRAALEKLAADLANRYAVFAVDFDGDDSASIAAMTKASLVVIAPSPADWPVELTAAVFACMDRAVPLVLLDAALAARTMNNKVTSALWTRLAVAQGCAEQAPAPAALFSGPKKSGPHPATNGVEKSVAASLTVTAAPRHVLEEITSDEAGRTRAWVTAYYVPAPVDRYGTVAVIPVSSAASLAAPTIRRLVLQAGLAVTGNSDLIPSAGVPVAP